MHVSRYWQRYDVRPFPCNLGPMFGTQTLKIFADIRQEEYNLKAMSEAQVIVRARATVVMVR